jgi:hypothetical protein
MDRNCTFYRHWANPSFLRLAVVFAPLTLIWTPFAILALMPFFLLYLAARVIQGKPELPSLTQFFWALAMGVIVTAFLTFDIASIPSKTGSVHARSTASGNFWDAYLPFFLMEFGVLATLLATRIHNSHGVFITAVLVLLALPFVFFGPSNDLMLRGSTPALVLLAIFTLITINNALDNQSTAAFPWLIVIALAIGACTPFNEMWRAITWKHWAPDYQRPLTESDNSHYTGTLHGQPTSHGISNGY